MFCSRIRVDGLRECRTVDPTSIRHRFCAWSVERSIRHRFCAWSVEPSIRHWFCVWSVEPSIRHHFVILCVDMLILSNIWDAVWWALDLWPGNSRSYNHVLLPRGCIGLRIKFYVSNILWTTFSEFLYWIKEGNFFHFFADLNQCWLLLLLSLGPHLFLLLMKEI